ncbi:GerW family sporulation protein [Alicyclobacillus fastidiosus]|uniref:GerW family sporulation protein n=1 Tax=Alicyclobacillus fastidiosus TaxID=392011 RepID=A0ABY6ZPJ1_9BACL|nr:GerW family sporulation protein [Alicyclobacillus fastidiosus]WAH44362.1 GerW family sporulation protein [Alicyclobacillus fastidiosus]GMA60694.1 putative spore protein YtfJ [Alicyclobacillus fastidiosus]
MDHPIQGLMQTAMSNIREMVDVNTIIGDPVETPDGTVILPVSKVGFGFAAGGSEFTSSPSQGNGSSDGENPFGGGSGGGVSITPIGFLIVHGNNVRLLSTDNQNQLYDRLIDMAPSVMERIQSFMQPSKKQGGAPAQASTPPVV